MKKIIKLLCVLLLVISLFGCKKDDEEIIGGNSEIDKPINNENVELKKSVIVQDLGYIPGEYEIGLILFKVSNNNTKDVKVTINIEYYDSSNRKIDSDEIYVRVGNNKATYAMMRMYVDKEPFSSYKFTYSVKSDEGYSDIYSKVGVLYSNSNGKVTIKTTNNSSRVTTATVYVIFYNSGKIIDVKDYKEYDVTSGSAKSGSVDYPVDRKGKKMKFDKVEVVLEQVTTDL